MTGAAASGHRNCNETRMPDIVDPTLSFGSDDTESFVACLAELLCVDPVDVPVDSDTDPLLQAREWLAERSLGLVPVLEPATFGWGGPWIARVPSGRCVLAFGAPPGVMSAPSGGDGPFVAGWVLAGLRPPEHVELPATSATIGTVAALLIAPAATAPMQRVREARAVAGRGLEGDRYLTGEGTFSEPGNGHEITLVDAQALDELGITPEEARRNVVTRGINLDSLVGRPFSVGGVQMVGRRRCEPCAHLERLTRPGVLRSLVHRGGLRADLLGGGPIVIGDHVELDTPA